MRIQEFVRCCVKMPLEVANALLFACDPPLKHGATPRVPCPSRHQGRREVYRLLAPEARYKKASGTDLASRGTLESFAISLFTFLEAEWPAAGVGSVSRAQLYLWSVQLTRRLVCDIVGSALDTMHDDGFGGLVEW